MGHRWKPDLNHHGLDIQHHHYLNEAVGKICRRMSSYAKKLQKFIIFEELNVLIVNVGA